MRHLISLCLPVGRALATGASSGSGASGRASGASSGRASRGARASRGSSGSTSGASRGGRRRGSHAGSRGGSRGGGGHSRVGGVLVLISTPDHTHFHAAITAMELGIHVCIEKPLAHNVWQCRTLKKA